MRVIEKQAAMMKKKSEEKKNTMEGGRMMALLCRKRSRRNIFVACCAAASSTIPVVEAWSSSAYSAAIGKPKSFSATTTTTRLHVSSTSSSSSTDDRQLLYDIDDQLLSSRKAQSYYNYDLYYDDDDDEEEDEDDDVFFAVSGVKRLQRSTGSEILDSDMQELVDQGPTSFLDQHVQDASFTEKVAMRSITEQLPQAAVQALSTKAAAVVNRDNNNSGNNKHYKDNLHFAKDQRVTPEQEIELARIIQQGAALHKLRTDAAVERGGEELTRQEWAELAGLTTKELRRQVCDYRKAKHNLVTANMGLVHTVVKQLWSSSSRFAQAGISKEELIQEGSLGLLRAAELFDPERGLRFSTYAVVWIKGTLSNSHVPELVRLPAREKTKWNKILQAQKNILAMKNPNNNNNSGEETAIAESSSGELRVPIEELAATTGLTVSEIVSTQRRMNQAGRVFSLDYQYKTQSRSGADDNNSDSSVASRITNGEEDLAERTQLQADILAAMAQNLDAREGRLMRLRYGLSSDGRARTLQECAEAMGLSYTRVHQLSQRCLKKLRQAAEAESLEEYLFTIA